MKRLDLEPTEQVLLESICEDRLGRNRDIIDFIRILADTEGPYSYMIDAPWGDGKTFFVKSISLILELTNPQLGKDSCNCAELTQFLTKLDDSTPPMLPFYFNAWSNDFADDPITALFANMAVEFDKNECLKKSKLPKALSAVIDTVLAAGQIPIRTSGIVDAISSESVIKAYQERLGIRSRINNLYEEVLKEVANKLVIFVDELDRCRPDFAVRLLEQTKNLFVSENVVFVFATDSSQLAKAVGGAYGPGFDAQRFLERFFDERIMMNPVDSYAVAHDGVPMSSRGRFDNLVAEIFASKVFTIRDQYRIKTDLQRAREYCFNSGRGDFPHQVAACTVLPLLVFIKRENIDLFRAITSGGNLDAVYEYGKQYQTFNSIVETAIEDLRKGTSNEAEENCADEERREYMHYLCAAIYGSDPITGMSYSEIRCRIGSFSKFDARVYKLLKFD
jgi:hypothetical protein